MVVVPLAAEGFGLLTAALHQHPEPPPSLPVEQLHAQLRVGLGPGGERLRAPEEGVGGMPDQLGRSLRHAGHGPVDPLAEGPLRRLHHMQLANAVGAHPVGQGRGEALGLDAVHSPAGSPDI